MERGRQIYLFHIKPCGQKEHLENECRRQRRSRPNYHNRRIRATPAPDGKTVFFAKTGFPEELWRVPAEGGTEEIVPEITAAGFSNIWIMKKEGIYFLSPISDQDFKLKFYDFTDEQVKDAPGDYKIPSNLDGTFITTDGNVLLCSVINKSSRLMLANLP